MEKGGKGHVERGQARQGVQKTIKWKTFRRKCWKGAKKMKSAGAAEQWQIRRGDDRKKKGVGNEKPSAPGPGGRFGEKGAKRFSKSKGQTEPATRPRKKREKEPSGWRR